MKLLLLAAAAAGLSIAQTQTAQSVMVNTTMESNSYQIEGTITWTFDREAAETHYTNAWDGVPPVVTVGTGAAQSSPGAPGPDANKLQQRAQADRCIFFNGGQLVEETYTQTVNGTRGWKWTYTYKIVPTGLVQARTDWSSETTGGVVNIGYTGFVASESFQNQANRTKYSFTLGTPGPDTTLSRVQNVTIRLQKAADPSGWTTVATGISNQALPVAATTANYIYLANGGAFGNAAVYGSLHYASGKPAASVNAILVEDNFANNNNDLASGNVHQANFGGTFPGISEGGTYQILTNGTIKGNASEVGQQFSVSSSLISIGGCSLP